MLRRYWGKNWRSNQENYSNIYRLKMHVGTNGSFQTLFRENLEFSKKMANFPSNNSRDIGRVLFLEVWNPSEIDSNLYWRAQPHETLWFNWMDQKVGKTRLVDQKNRFQIGQCRHQRMKNCLWGVTLAYSNIYLILPPLYKFRRGAKFTMRDYHFVNLPQKWHRNHKNLCNCYNKFNFKSKGDWKECSHRNGNEIIKAVLGCRDCLKLSIFLTVTSDFGTKLPQVKFAFSTQKLILDNFNGKRKD